VCNNTQEKQLQCLLEQSQCPNQGPADPGQWQYLLVSMVLYLPSFSHYFHYYSCSLHFVVCTKHLYDCSLDELNKLDC